MCRKAIAKQNYVATGKLPPLIAARLYWLILIPISASPGFIKALRADGQPLMFGYEVNDIHGHNIGVVGQEASYLFAPMKYRHRLMWQLISNKDFHAQSPSVKRLMKVEIIFASNSQVVLWKFA